MHCPKEGSPLSSLEPIKLNQELASGCLSLITIDNLPLSERPEVFQEEEIHILL